MTEPQPPHVFLDFGGDSDYVEYVHEARVAELEAALRTAHYWMQLGFKGEAVGRSGAGEADAEVRAALTGFPHQLKGKGNDAE